MKVKRIIQPPWESILYDMVLLARGIPWQTRYLDCEIMRQITWWQQIIPSYIINDGHTPFIGSRAHMLEFTIEAILNMVAEGCRKDNDDATNNTSR